MKTTLLIGEKRATLFLEAESATEREVLLELRRRQVQIVCEFGSGETRAPDATQPCSLPAREVEELPEEATIADLIRAVLPDMPSVFHYKEIREAIRRRFPRRFLYPHEVYNGVATLLKTQEVQRTQGGFMLGAAEAEVAAPPGAVPTAKGETVAVS